MINDIKAPLKIQTGGKSDYLCDENFVEHHVSPELEARAVIVELCQRAVEREVKAGDLIKLPAPIGGYDYFEVREPLGWSLHARLKGVRREVITGGVTVKLGRLDAHGKFQASDWLYQAQPPHPDAILEDPATKSKLVKIVPPL